jgi:hypothetical protein
MGSMTNFTLPNGEDTLTAFGHTIQIPSGGITRSELVYLTKDKNHANLSPINTERTESGKPYTLKNREPIAYLK